MSGGEPNEHTRTASCVCGQLRAICAGAPASVNLCSCEACQRRSGSAFAYTAFFPAVAVTVEGKARQYRRACHSGEVSETHFCPDCGAAVFARLGVAPDLVAVAAGCFADQCFEAPQRHFWTRTRHRWLTPLAGAEEFERQ